MIPLMVFYTEEEQSKFTRLYNNYHKIVYFTIKRFINNDYDIEDYMQDIYLIIGHNLSKIKENDELKTRNYIITIARNYCIGHWRKKRIQEEEFTDTQDFIDEKNNPLNILITKETYAALIEAIAKLEDKYRAALELKYINDLDDNTIAKVLNIKTKNVQMRIYRAKLMVKKNMGVL